jgi:hypothetical protein
MDACKVKLVLQTLTHIYVKPSAFAAFFISPIELFRTRMQSVDGVNGFRSVLSGVQTMVKQHGPSSLWRGLVPTMWRDVPFSGKKSICRVCYIRNDTRLTACHSFLLDELREITITLGCKNGNES